MDKFVTINKGKKNNNLQKYYIALVTILDINTKHPKKTAKLRK